MISNWKLSPTLSRHPHTSSSESEFVLQKYGSITLDLLRENETEILGSLSSQKRRDCLLRGRSGRRERVALNFCGGIVSDLRLELQLTVPYPERRSDDLRLGVLRYQSSLLGPSEAQWSQLTASRHIQKTKLEVLLSSRWSEGCRVFPELCCSPASQLSANGA